MTQRMPLRFADSLLAMTVAGLCAIACTAQAALSPFPSEVNLDGNWQCTGSFRGNKAHRTNFQVDHVLAGKWLRLTEQDVEPATGYTAEYLIGVDAAAKTLVEFDANNFGAAIYRSSTGWTDGTLVMTSAANNDPAARYKMDRFSYTASSAERFQVLWETSRTGNGDWAHSDTLACSRIPATSRANP